MQCKQCIYFYSSTVFYPYRFRNGNKWNNMPLTRERERERERDWFGVFTPLPGPHTPQGWKAALAGKQRVTGHHREGAPPDPPGRQPLQSNSNKNIKISCTLPAHLKPPPNNHTHTHTHTHTHKGWPRDSLVSQNVLNLWPLHCPVQGVGSCSIHKLKFWSTSRKVYGGTNQCSSPASKVSSHAVSVNFYDSSPNWECSQFMHMWTHCWL